MLRRVQSTHGHDHSRSPAAILILTYCTLLGVWGVNALSLRAANSAVPSGLEGLGDLFLILLGLLVLTPISGGLLMRVIQIPSPFLIGFLGTVILVAAGIVVINGWFRPDLPTVVLILILPLPYVLVAGVANAIRH